MFISRQINCNLSVRVADNDNTFHIVKHKELCITDAGRAVQVEVDHSVDVIGSTTGNVYATTYRKIHAKSIVKRLTVLTN